jgi:hypothetical protein
VGIFFGGDMPFIIRPDGIFYKLVGAAYVHGIMLGELMKGSRMLCSPRLPL